MAPKRKSSRKQESEASSSDVKKIRTDDDSPKETGEQCSDFNKKILSWNVDGCRAWLKKNGMAVFKSENPDVVCLQETKCSSDKLPPELKNVKGYKSYFFGAKKEGYSGVAVFSKDEPLNISYGIEDTEHDDEGRCITAEYDQFYLVTAYVPNAGRKLVTLDKRMDWDPKLKAYLKKLDEKKPVVYCGDLNVAHKEIDLKNPKTNTKNAGFTKEEKEGFSDLLHSGFVDSFRHFYPDKKDQYSFWTYMMNCRARNIGWRLDYFVVSERFMESVCDSLIKPEYMGSDHCPIVLLLKI